VLKLSSYFVKNEGVFMKNYFAIVILTSVSISYLLTACGESSQTSSVQNMQTQVPSNPLEPRYQATLSEGITFSNPGYPSFVAAVKGISIQEVLGRWTDSTEARIEFVQPLPRKFTLKITATTFPASVGKAVKVVIGGVRYDAEFPQQWNFKEITIPVTTESNVKSITFELPDAKSPNSLGLNSDVRMLSLYLSSLKIIEK
jgi:phosphoglycerol transferase